MKIWHEIYRNALKNLRETCKSNIALAKKLNIHPAQLSRLMKGKTQFLKDRTWAKIEPLLRPAIDEQFSQLPPPDLRGDRDLGVLVHLLAAAGIPDDERAEFYRDVTECAMRKLKKYNK